MAQQVARIYSCVTETLRPLNISPAPLPQPLAAITVLCYCRSDLDTSYARDHAMFALL